MLVKRMTCSTTKLSLAGRIDAVSLPAHVRVRSLAAPAPSSSPLAALYPRCRLCTLDHTPIAAAANIGDLLRFNRSAMAWKVIPNSRIFLIRLVSLASSAIAGQLTACP